MPVDETGILDSIYAAAVAPMAWPALLGTLAGGFGAHFVGFVVQPDDRSRVRAMVHGVDAAVHAAFLRRWHRANPVARRMIAAPDASGVMRISDAMAEAEFAHSEIYADFFGPNALHHGLRLDAWRGDGESATFSLARDRRRGDFSAEELDRAWRLRPHLARAIAVGRHLRGTELVRDAAFAGLDRLCQGVVLLDAAGLVLHANRSAAALFAAGDGIRMAARALVPAMAALSGDCEAALRRANHGQCAAPVAGAMLLPRTGEAPALTMVAMPLPARLGWDLVDPPAVLVFLHDPLATTRHSPRLLSELFGLTDAEAMLAIELAQGRTPAEISQRSRRSMSTVRTHLARLLQKTGSDRQSTLLRRLAALPDDGTG